MDIGFFLRLLLVFDLAAGMEGGESCAVTKEAGGQFASDIQVGGSREVDGASLII